EELDKAVFCNPIDGGTISVPVGKRVAPFHCVGTVAAEALRCTAPPPGSIRQPGPGPQPSAFETRAATTIQTGTRRANERRSSSLRASGSRRRTDSGVRRAFADSAL